MISATESTVQQPATMSASFAAVESPKSRSDGSTGVGNRQFNVSKPASAPSRVQSIRIMASQPFRWKRRTNAPRNFSSAALDDTAPAMNGSPTEQQNTKASSSITGDTLCSHPPAPEEPAITPALITTSKPQQIAPPAIVDGGINTLNPENSDEMKRAVDLGYKSPEFQDSVVVLQEESTQVSRGTEKQLKPGQIQDFMSSPKTSPTRHDASPVSIQSSNPWTWTLPKKTSQKKISPRPTELLEAFGRICARPSLSICHKQPQPGRPFFSTGTHMKIAVFDDTLWGFLFFQRPDNWIQPALIRRDSSRKAILLQPLVEATKDSPLWCDIDENVSNSTLRLFFSCDSGSESLLSEVKIEFGDNGQTSWSVIPLQRTFPGNLDIRKFIYGAFDQGKIVLTCVTSSQILVRYREQEDGSWLPITYPCEISTSPGDLIYDSTAVQGSELRVRTLNQTEINLYAVHGVVNLVDINSSEAEDMETEAQEMVWHGIPPNSESFSCQLIRCVHSVDGVVYKTANNEVYLRRGNPWCYNEGDEADEAGATVVPGPKKICTIKAGSEFVVCESWRELLYFSQEGEMMRIKFTVDESGEITFGDPCSVFSEDWSQASLDDLLLPDSVDDYLIQSGQRGTKASESDLASSYYTGTSASSASSDRRTRDSRYTFRNPSVDSRVMQPSRGSSIDSRLTGRSRATE